MRPGNLFCALFAALLLSACAASPPAPSPPPPPGSGAKPFLAKQCAKGGCEATVKVTVVAGAPTVKISDPELKMKKRDRNVIIMWILDAPDDWEFRADSIVPHTGAPANGKQTTSQQQWDLQIRHVGRSTTRFIVQNANDLAGDLYYDVKVYDPAGTPWLIDPAIMNDP